MFSSLLLLLRLIARLTPRTLDLALFVMVFVA
jgi:hypothetical protein